MTAEVPGGLRDRKRTTKEREPIPGFPSFSVDALSAPHEIHSKILSLANFVNRPLLIGVVGPSGSGKTALTARIASLFAHDDLAVINSDAYAIPRPKDGLALRMRNKGSIFEDGTVDNENPAGYRLDMLLSHVKRLLSGREIPLAVIATRRNLNGSWIIGKIQPPDKAIVLEGLSVLDLVDSPTRNPSFDFVVVLDCDPRLLFIRRMIRDTSVQYWIRQDFSEFLDSYARVVSGFDRYYRRTFQTIRLKQENVITIVSDQSVDITAVRENHPYVLNTAQFYEWCMNNLAGGEVDMYSLGDNEYVIISAKSGEYFYYKVGKNNHFLVFLSEDQKTRLIDILGRKRPFGEYRSIYQSSRQQ